MISLYSRSSPGVVVTSDEAITFDNIVTKTCSCTRNNSPANTIVLNRSGYYRIHFDGVVANNTASPGVVTVQLYNNGVKVDSGFASETSESGSDIVNLNLDTIIQIRPSCSAVSNIANLQFRVEGVDSLMFFANAYVERIA